MHREKTFLSKIRNIIDTTRDSGISVGSNFIVGLPDDTTQSCIETADLAIDLATEFINIYPCIDLPGSSIHLTNKKVEDGNYLKYGFLSYHTIPNGTQHMSPQEILSMRDQLWTKIYSSPTVLSTIQNALVTLLSLILSLSQKFVLGASFLATLILEIHYCILKSYN